MSTTESWKTKPSDRFVLRWIKCHLSSRITPRLLGFPWLRPWMITVSSATLGVVAGGLFALGWAVSAGVLAGIAQILDGVDGQFARITGTESKGGAFLDSVLDRYADGSMVLGMLVYLLRLESLPLSSWLVGLVGFLALAGSGLVSYTSARAESLGLSMGAPTLASKGTRTSVMVLCALGTLLWPFLPVAALVYLAVHPNVVVIRRLLRGCRAF